MSTWVFIILSETTTSNHEGCSVLQNSSCTQSLTSCTSTASQAATLWPLQTIVMSIDITVNRIMHSSIQQCSNTTFKVCIAGVSYEIYQNILNSLFVAYLKRERWWHHGFIIWVVIRIPKFIRFLPLNIRTSVEAQASSWISTQQCNMTNKQMCVGTDQRMLEKFMQYCCLDTGGQNFFTNVCNSGLSW